MGDVAWKNDVPNSVSVTDPSIVGEVINIPALLPNKIIFWKPAFNVVAGVLTRKPSKKLFASKAVFKVPILT